jgi:hypothetical protein
MHERSPLGVAARRLVPVALLILFALPRGASAQAAGALGVDTLFARAADEVVSALASALSQRDLVAGASPQALMTALRDAMAETSSGIVRTASQLVDSAGLARLVTPGAARFIGSSGGRYVLDVVVTEVVQGETRVRVAPLLIALVPGSDSPLGGRPLPSAGVVERETLATIAASFAGGPGGGS